MTRTTAYREVRLLPECSDRHVSVCMCWQMLYDIDGVRVVERRVPLWLQESYEIIPSWPEGEPVPHLFPPKPARGPLSSIYHHLHTKLADTPSPPNPPQVVTQLANSVSVLTSCPPLYRSVIMKTVSKFSSFPCRLSSNIHTPQTTSR